LNRLGSPHRSSSSRFRRSAKRSPTSEFLATPIVVVIVVGLISTVFLDVLARVGQPAR
jgi:hypothetical protein